VKLQTSLFDEIEVNEEQIIQFPQGLPGFENLNEFILLQPEEVAPFSIMQAVQDGSISFIVTDPFLFFKEYEFELPELVQEQLHISNNKDVAIWTIVTIPESLEEATMNLQAPLVINNNGRLGKQVILHDGPYKTKHRLFQNAQE
jgi:flagellar assembly factor FliW